MKPDHLSWSQINMLNRCGEQYKRRYILGERVPPGLAMLRGRATHTSQESNLVWKLETGDLLHVDQVMEIAASAWDKEVDDGNFILDGDYADMSTKDALGRGKDESVELAELHAERVAPGIDPSAVEVRIEIPPSNALDTTFVSILDVIDDEDTIIDTKTTGKSPPAGAADDSDQLTSQALAFEARYGYAPDFEALDYLIRTRTGKLSHRRLLTERTPEDLATFVRRAQASLEMIEREVFLPAPTDSWACSQRFCGYADTCPFFRGQKRPTN